MTTRIDEPTLERALATAQPNGWRLVRDSTHGPTQSVTLERGEGERLDLYCWSQLAQGGQGTVRSYSGAIASGQVSLRQVQDRSGWFRQEEIDQLLHQAPPNSYDNNSGFMLAVNEGESHEYWETASNYTTHRLCPGLYPIELVSIEYQRASEPAKAYYAMARVHTYEIYRHYVNRLFTASSAHDEKIDPPRPSSFTWTAYSYQLQKLHDNPTEGKFQVVKA